MNVRKNEKIRSFEFCTVYTLYDAVQHPMTRLFIDIRPRVKYRECHLFHAINLPRDVITDDEMIKLFKNRFFFDNLYIYGDYLNFEKDSQFCNHLQTLFDSKLKENTHCLSLLDCDFKVFSKKYPFLCVFDHETKEKSSENLNKDKDLEEEEKTTDEKNKDDKKEKEKEIGKQKENQYKGSKKKKTKKRRKKKDKDCIDIYYEEMNSYPRYPDQIINDKLFLGSIDQINQSVLKDLKISHIINMTSIDYTNEVSQFIQQTKVKYLQIKINDEKNVSICDHFQSTFDFISKALELESDDDIDTVDINDENKVDGNGNSNGIDNKVFVHCKEGISRSATIVIAFLMRSKQFKFRFDEALKYVQTRRPIVDPNPGFRNQLKQLDAQLYSVDSK